MPWSSTPTAPAPSSRLGWSAAGPPVPVIPPRTGWWPVLVRAASDGGLGEDTAALLAHLVATDPGAGTDTAALLAHLLATDTGAGADTAALLAHLLGSDQGTGSDSASWLLHLDRLAVDEARGEDTAALLAHLMATDQGVGVDSAALLAHLFVTDQGLGEDSARPAYMNPYSGSKAATTVPDASWTDLLTYTASGNGTAGVNFSVAHSWQRDLFNVVSNTRGVRILVAGTQVAIQTQTYTNATWSSTLTQNGVSVPAGAAVRIQGYCENGLYTASRTVTISAASMTVINVT